MNWLNFADFLSEINESLVGDFVALQFFFLEAVVSYCKGKLPCGQGTEGTIHIKQVENRH